MASEERKATNSEIKEENLLASYGAAKQEAETDAFHCGICKQRTCRYRLVSGDLSTEKISTMSSEEMASEERKAANSEIKEENLFASYGAAEQEGETDAFQCGRCKQRKCRYRQAQTRSADEPMTTFVTCTVCNNRWKFS